LYEQNVAAINLFTLFAPTAAGKVWRDSQDDDEDDYGALGAQRPVEQAIGS
jgi:hypothetical protein